MDLSKFSRILIALFIVLPFTLAVPLEAANQLRFFFPECGDPANALDDRAVDKMIFWSGENDSIFWVVHRLGGFVIPPFTNDPFEGGNNVQPDEVREAIQEAVNQWNDGLSGFSMEEDVLFSDDIAMYFDFRPCRACLMADLIISLNRKNLGLTLVIPV